MAMQNEIKEYIKSVKKQIICPTAESRQMLRELQANVSDFVQENPDADMVQIVEQFGTPEEIAKMYIADTEPKNIKKAVNIRKLIVIAVAIIIAIVAVSCIISIIDNHSGKIAYYSETIMEGTSTVIVCARYIY